MPFPLFVLGLRGAALRRRHQLDAAIVSAQAAEATELMDLLWSLRQAAGPDA